MVQHANLEGKESTFHKHLLVLYLHRHNEQTHIRSYFSSHAAVKCTSWISLSKIVFSIVEILQRSLQFSNKALECSAQSSSRTFEAWQNSKAHILY